MTDTALHALFELAQRHEGNPLLVGVIVQDAVASATAGDRNRLDVAVFTERLTTLTRRTSAYQGRHLGMGGRACGESNRPQQENTE